MARIQTKDFFRLSLSFLVLLSLTSPVFAGKYDKKLAKRTKILVAAATKLPSPQEIRDLVDAESDGNAKAKLRLELKNRVDQTLEKAAEYIEKFGATDNAKAVKDLVGFGLMPCKNSNVEVELFGSIQSALAGMEDEKALASMKKFFLKSRKFEIKMMFVDICGESKSEVLLEALHEQIKVSPKKVDARVITAVANTLKSRKDKRSVRPMIVAFGLWKKLGGLTFRTIFDGLYEMTGRRFEEAADYEAFWDPREATYDPEKIEKEPVGGSVERKAPRIFGSEVVSKKVVIILDISGSMAWKDAGSNKKDDAPPPSEGTIERGSDEDKKLGGDPGKYKGPSLSPDMDGYDDVPADRMRLNRAKRQIANLVKQFSPSTQFNVVTFSADSNAWKSGKIVAASAGSKKSAIKFVESLSPEHHTMAFLGLEEAFRCKDADTFYFISDGYPTTPEGMALNKGQMNELVERVAQINKLRRVQIHTIGMKGAYPDFMKRLSKATGGKYRQVD